MDEEIKEKVFKQMMDLWINPEINRRTSLNKLADDFSLSAAQVVFSLEKNYNEIRLNDEVKAKAKSKLNVSKNKGDLIYEHEVEDIQSIELTGEDINCAHITLLRIKDKWTISFDFIYNKKIIQDHIEAAKEFFESAKDNLTNERIRPFFENSFACAELLAKATLLQLPDKNMLYGKDHYSRIEKFRNWAVLGNTKKEHSDVLEKLNKLRDSARYLSSLEFKKEDPKEIIKTLEEMLNVAEKIKK